MVEAMKIINNNPARIVLVVDGKGRLTGAVTDGDIRRGLLRGLSTAAPVSKVANGSPLTARPENSTKQIGAIMEKAQIRQVPLIDDDGRVVGLVTEDELTATSTRNNDVWVVLMAGGRGMRLRPLTDDTPKPMLLVGDKPILETILTNLINQGFRKFFLSVHFMAGTIRDYFGDGAKWGVEIRYLAENEPLGTAGALGLLTERPDHPFIVMNADLLTKVDFGHVLDFHQDQKVLATMGVRQYDIEIEYGVVEVDHDRITNIREKPVHQFLVNAGIYVLDPVCLDRITSNTYLDMPAMFQGLIDDGHKCTVFPIVEYWLDIGRLKDFEHAKNVVATI